MELNEIKDKYKKAHETYLKYKDINGTNNTEKQFIPEALQALEEIFPNSTIIEIGDNILNYLGVDFIVDYNGRQTFIDLKVCQHCHDKEVVIDAYKHNNDKWFPASDVKINDTFLFINADNIILVPAEFIPVPPIEECWFYRRDLKRTTKKATIDLSGIRKRVFPRKHTN